MVKEVMWFLVSIKGGNEVMWFLVSIKGGNEVVRADNNNCEI
jgi:hypothetical protein